MPGKSLRNDGDMYARILKEAGVQVIHRAAPYDSL